MKKTNVTAKNSELTLILNTHFKGKLNLARVKLISYFVIALCKVQTVTFEKLANAFGTSVDRSRSSQHSAAVARAPRPACPQSAGFRFIHGCLPRQAAQVFYTQATPAAIAAPSTPLP